MIDGSRITCSLIYIILNYDLFDKGNVFFQNTSPIKSLDELIFKHQHRSWLYCKPRYLSINQLFMCV